MGLLEFIIALLVVLWLLGGFVVPVGGDLIHVLLVLAVIIVLFRYLPWPRGRCD